MSLSVNFTVKIWHHNAGSYRHSAMEMLERRQLLSGVDALPVPLPVAPLSMPPAVFASGPVASSPESAFASDLDIGSPAIAGSTNFSNGVYTVTGNGGDIGGNSDQFHFASNPWTADGSIVVRVTSLTNTHNSAKAGLMIRNGSSATAAFAGVFLTPASGLTFIVRSIDGATAGATILPGLQVPRFLKLTRAGAQISAYYSTDAITWSQAGSTQSVSLGANTLVGLAVTSRNVSALASAIFTNVSVLLPNGWSDNDIGSPGLPGGAVFNPVTNAFWVSGSGLGIGSTADQFNFVGCGTLGDGSVVARINQQTLTDPAARAGVMIRDNLTTGSRFASIVGSPGGDLIFQSRSSAGGVAGSTTIGGPGGAVWVKLSQTGSSVSAFYSTNQSNWVQIGSSQTIAMTSSTAMAGLAVISGSNLSINDASFSGVSVLQGEWENKEVGATAAIGSAVFDGTSNTYTMSGSGADIYGPNDAFNFTSRAMTGDGGVVTFVNSIANTSEWAKAGIIIRVSGDANSAFVGIFVSPANSIVFEWRTASGAAVDQQIVSPGGGPITAPVSLKLTRTGNTFRGSYSTDGVSWLQAGSDQTVAMPAATLAGMAVTSHNDGVICTASFTGTAVGNKLPPGAGIYSASDEAFLNDLEYRTFLYFYNETNPNTGLVPDGALAAGGSNGSPCSIAALGFGLTALTIADQRGWISHADAYQRAMTTVNFLYTTAAQVNGFYYHFLNTTTGARSGGSELSSIDTAELMAGVINVGQHWAGTPIETAATNIYNRVNWPWMLKPNNQFYGAWTPEEGFSGGYVDFSEGVLLYLIALGSPTHPVTQASWNAWTRYPTVHYNGYTFITATNATLFTVQYPQAWYDLRGLTDSFGLNYYVNAQTATLAQRQWMIDLKPTYPSFGPNMWGLTASDGATGYTVWGGPPAFGPINGTVVPTGPGGSLAFTPRHSVDALRHMRQTYGNTVYKKYGFVDAFNPSVWTSSIVLGIDAGMMLIAAENSRSNFVWNIFGQSAVARQSLAAAFPSLTPEMLSAVSRKVRPNSTFADTPLKLSGDPAVEARTGGPTQLVLNFGANIVKGSGFALWLTNASGGGNGGVTSSTVSGSTLTINLSGTSDAQTLIVHVNDLRNYSTAAIGNYTLSLDVLLADATHDGKVNSLDFNALAGNFGAAAASDAQGDFNFDAIVDSVDFNHLLVNYGKVMASLATGLFAVSFPSPFAAMNEISSSSIDLLSAEPGSDLRIERSHRLY